MEYYARMGIDLTAYQEAIDGALANRTPCVVATASARGEPNVSLRGSTMVFDAEHLAYWDRTHGRQLEHLGENPHVVVFYRDAPRRTSWRFYGQATVHPDGPIREQVMARVVEAELNRDPERTGAAVVVRVDLVMTLGNQVLQRREGQPATPARTLNLFEAMHTARAIRRFQCAERIERAELAKFAVLAHTHSSRGTSSWSRISPCRAQYFTLPSGAPSRDAIWLCDSPSKYAISRT